MTTEDDVICHTVNNVLLHLTTLGKTSPEPSPYLPDAENRTNLSGVIVRVAEITSAAIGIHPDKDSTRTLVLSEPVFIPEACPERRAHWFRQMLSGAISFAQQHDFSRIRFLDWESQNDAMPWITRELERADFSASASVVGWQTTAEQCLQRTCSAATVRLSTADLQSLSESPQTGGPSTISPASDATRTHQRLQDIVEALDQILKNTDDLTTIDAPNGNDLLQKWSTQECTLLVAEAETGVAGLCAFAFTPSRTGDLAATGQIEYLGVRKEMQRQGIATQMLAYLCRGVSRGSDLPVEITAFADETNFPASSFYLRSGFEPQCRGKLWYHEVNHHSKQKEPS